LFKKLYDHWYPPPPEFGKSNLELNKQYQAIQQALNGAELARLSTEVASGVAEAASVLRQPSRAERHLAAQMLTMLENAYFVLHLDRNAHHPIHNGWMETYRRWFASPTFRAAWRALQGEFSHVFQEFVKEQVPRLFAVELREQLRQEI
jgi:hypothetical protein